MVVILFYLSGPDGPGAGTPVCTIYSMIWQLLPCQNQFDGYWQNIFQNAPRWQSNKSIKKWGGSQLNANIKAKAYALTTVLSDIRSDFRLETEDILCARGI